MLTPLRFSGMYRMEGDDATLRRTSARIREFASILDMSVNIREVPQHPEYRDVYTKQDVHSRTTPPGPPIQASTVWQQISKQRFDLATGEITEKSQNYLMKKPAPNQTSATTPAQPGRYSSSPSYGGLHVSERGIDRSMTALEILALILQPWKWFQDN